MPEVTLARRELYQVVEQAIPVKIHGTYETPEEAWERFHAILAAQPWMRATMCLGVQAKTIDVATPLGPPAKAVAK